MVVYAQSGMEFHHKEKDGGEIPQLGQFHIVLELQQTAFWFIELLQNYDFFWENNDYGLR